MLQGCVATKSLTFELNGKCNSRRSMNQGIWSVWIVYQLYPYYPSMLVSLQILRQVDFLSIM